MNFEIPALLEAEVKRIDQQWDAMTFRDRFVALEGVIRTCREVTNHPRWGSETDLSDLFKRVVPDRKNSKNTAFWGTHHFTYINSICRTTEDVREFCFKLIDEQGAPPSTVNALLRHAKDASELNMASTRDVLLSMVHKVRELSPNGVGLRGAWSEEVETELRRAFNLTPLPKRGQRRQRTAMSTPLEVQPHVEAVEQTEEPRETPVSTTTSQPSTRPRTRPVRPTRDIVANMSEGLEQFLALHLTNVPEGHKDPIRIGARRLLRDCLSYVRQSSLRMSRLAEDKRIVDAKEIRSSFESAYRALMGVRPSPGPFLDIRDVKVIFHEQARACHPDTHPDDTNAHTKFIQLSELYSRIRFYFEQCQLEQKQQSGEAHDAK